MADFLTLGPQKWPTQGTMVREEANTVEKPFNAQMEHEVRFL